MKAQNKTPFRYTGKYVKKTADTCNKLPGRVKKQYLVHITVPFLHCPCTTLVAIIYNLCLLQIAQAQSLPRGRCVLMPPCCLPV